MPPCSVIIPVYNKASLTSQCLEALLGAPQEQTEYEIIVVDDASSDRTPDMLAEYDGHVRALSHPTNCGYATSCNDAARIARGEWLVLLNNDTIPLAGWLDALLGYARAHPQVGVIGSKLLFPDDTVQHAGMVVCQDRFLRHIYVGFPASHPAVNKSRRFQAVTAACMLVRRSLYVDMGGFDATFLNGYEDTDFCLRIGERGHEVHYCHESVLYHLECATRDVTNPQEHTNEKLYLHRWADRVTPDEFLYYMEDGLLQVNYPATYPLVFDLSPQLAVQSNDPERRADRMLEMRAQQVYSLLKENVRLNIRAREAEFRAGHARPARAGS